VLQKVTVGEICVAESDRGGNLCLQKVTVGEICVAESDCGGNLCCRE